MYTKFPQEKVLGMFTSTEKKTYIDEMMYRAFATPPPYENIDSLILKSKGHKGIKFDSIKTDRFKRIVKTPDPGPGTYNYEPCLEKLRAVSRGHALSKSSKNSFFMTESKKRGNVPPVGHYKNIDNGIAKTSKHYRKPRR